MINGKWYAKGSSAQADATLLITEDSFVLKVKDGMSYSALLHTLDVGGRLGNVTRKITLEDGSVFATQDNDAIDLAFKKQLPGKGLLHSLESNMHWVITSIALTLILGFGFFKWGVPWASEKIAHALPYETNQLIASNTLDFLDEYVFEESKISEEQKQKIRMHFKSHIVPLAASNDEIKYKLHFRLWKNEELSIPNALALPAGDIILTDKFVQLCENQDEMDAVLLHEMGHIEHRHSLTMLIESTFVAVAVMMIVGDSNGFVDAGVGLGSLLVSSNYSRGHESQADLFAFKHMLHVKRDPIVFSNIMNRMTGYMQTATNSTIKQKESEPEASVLDYLSSHPNTKQRVEIARQYSECFHKSLTTCEIIDPDGSTVKF
ncbi:MAG: M48 family metallopeptidase [Gammaproteobacteria bacterium]